MRTLIVLSLVAACGGGTPPPAPPPTVEPAAEPTPTEPAAQVAPAEPAPAENDVLAASALAEQYEVGKQVYADKKCVTCHEANGAGNPKNPPVIGDAALPKDPPKAAKLRAGITFTTAADVVAFVKAKMPPKAPGTLTDDEAHAVVAWLLDSNKVQLTKKLDASNAATIQLR